MDLLIEVIPFITSRRNEEDMVDRLNFQYTAYFFGFAAALIMSKQYMGTPIECWTPAEFRKGWNEYARDYCLIENTYFVPLDDPNLPDFHTRTKQELPYYQWVQFVLVILAFFFMVPHFFWRSVNWQTGIQVRSIIDTCAKLVGQPGGEQATPLKKVASNFSRSFAAQSSSGGAARGLTSLFARSTNGQYVTLCYVITKLLFIINIIVQLFVLHVFLGFTPILAFSDGINSDWKNTGLFPRSTMCDFEVRGKGNIQRYSVQCVLSLNMFNEKIFVLIFAWLTVLLLATIGNAFQWLMFVYSDSSRRNFAVRMLKSQGIVDPASRQPRHPAPRLQQPGSSDLELEPLKKPLYDEQEEDSTVVAKESNVYADFVQLSPDQALVLRLVAANAGDLVAGRLFRELYNIHKEREN